MQTAGLADPLLAAPLRPLTLRFRDDALERRFAQAQALKSLRPGRIALLSAAAAMAVLWVLHEWMAPKYRVFPQMDRVAMMSLLSVGVVYAATYLPLFVRQHQVVMATLATVLSVGIVAASLRLPPDVLVARGFLLLMLHIFSIYTLLMRFPAAFVSGIAGVLLYFVAAQSTGVFDARAMAATLFWLVIANAWGGLICYQLDVRTRREFVALNLLGEERERSERLLLNILPAPVAERLKSSGDAIAEHADNVTVMFADLVGFTPLSARKTPAELVALLDRVFSAFDALADEHGLEKIKTIGDAYMAVAGLPQPCADHAARAARMAAAMLDAVRRIARETGEPLELRIGLNSGAVVAGVIGRRKFIYDMWGDTVNTASRMESHGAPGTIHCTRATADLLPGFALQSRGLVEVKGKGELETFVVVV